MALSVSPESILLPKNYEYKFIKYDQKEGTNFTASFKIKNIKSGDQFLSWLKEYQEKSKFIWRIARTRSATGKFNVFGRDYRCQHKSDPRYRQKLKRKSKNTDCLAALRVSIKRYSDHPKLKSVDEETKEYPCVVDLYSWHNHSSDSALALRFRDMSISTKEKLLLYYQTGHAVASARNALKMELLLQNFNDYATLSADYSIIPTLSTISHLFAKFSKKGQTKYGDSSEDLKHFLKNYCDSTGGKALITVINSQKVVALCTPIMLRTIEHLPQVQDIILVESYKNVGKLNNHMYFFISPSIAGGAPIGCIITEGENAFATGVQLLKSCLPDNFKSGPKVFLIDDDLEGKAGLKETWPNSEVLLSQFHVLKEVWRWDLDTKHGITENERLHMYFLVKELIYSTTEGMFLNKMAALNQKISNNKCLKFIYQLWGKRSLWAPCYQNNVLISKRTTDTYTEGLFRILRDLIFDRIKITNLIQLVHFTVTNYEVYLKQRYLHFSEGDYNKTLLKHFSADKKNLISCQYMSSDQEKDVYFIESAKGKFTVDMNSCLCSCHIGLTGHMCRHIVSIIYSQIDSMYFIPHYNAEMNKMMLAIATDKNPAENSLVLHFDKPNKSETSREMDIDSSDTHNNRQKTTDSSAVDCEMTDEEIEKVKKEFAAWYLKACKSIDNNTKLAVPAIKKIILNGLNL